MIDWEDFRAKRIQRQEEVNLITRKVIEEMIGEDIQEKILHELYQSAKLGFDVNKFVDHISTSLRWENVSASTIDSDAVSEYLGLAAERAIIRFHELSGIPITRLRKETDTNGVEVLSNPEFLREGTAIFDSLFPDRVVVGGRDKAAIKEVFSLYRRIESDRSVIAAKAGIAAIEQPRQVEYMPMSRNSAELVKVAANAFLAMKISFANFIAVLADARTVLKAIGMDSRIGPAFLRPSLGWAGGCFPKDVKALINRSKHHGVVPDILEATQSMNARMRGHMLAKIEDRRAARVAGAEIAVLGLSFKEGTSDVRESASIKFAYQLADRGANVRVYDPAATEEANMDNRVRVEESLDAACRDAEVIVVAVRWEEFLGVPLDRYASLAQQGAILVDAVDGFNEHEVSNVGMAYVGIGR